MENLKQVFYKKGDFVVKQVDEDYLIVPLRSSVANMNVVFTTNEVGHFIWQQIDGLRDVEAILTQILDEFEIDRTTAENDLEAFLEKIKEIIEVK